MSKQIGIYYLTVKLNFKNSFFVDQRVCNA